MKIILKHYQGHFAQEIVALQSRRRRRSKKKSKLLSFNPFVDGVEMLRVDDRLRNAPLSYSQKFPIILATRDQLIELIIRDAHLRNMRAGSKVLVSLIGE